MDWGPPRSRDKCRTCGCRLMEAVLQSSVLKALSESSIYVISRHDCGRDSRLEKQFGMLSGRRTEEEWRTQQVNPAQQKLISTWCGRMGLGTESCCCLRIMWTTQQTGH